MGDSKMRILRDAAQIYQSGENAELSVVLPRVTGIVLQASKTELVFSKQELQYIIDFGFLNSEDEAIVTTLQAAVGAIELDLEKLRCPTSPASHLEDSKQQVHERRRRLFTGADLTAYFQK